MKICAVTTWPPHPDGISLYSAQLYGQIGKKVEVKVLANIVDSGEEGSGVEGDCRVVRCWRRGSITYPFKIFSRVLAEKPDIIHLQHGWLLYGDKICPLLFPLLLLLLRLTRRPIIVTIHTVIGGRPRLHERSMVNFIARIIVMLLTRVIVKLSSMVIVHNNLMRWVLRNLYSLNKDLWKIFVIPHGVKEAARKPRKILGDEGIKILSLGFIRKSKGIEYLIEAFKIFSAVYPKSSLIIVGGRHAHDNGKYFEALRRRLRDGMGNIIFTGFIDEKTLDNLIWNSEIIVLPSVGSHYIEASGSLARVAMYGKPIICGRVPKFTADLEDGKDCIMIEFDNPEKLAEALLLLARDAGLRRRIGRNLRNKFRDRVWSKVAEQHIDLFKDAAGIRQFHAALAPSSLNH
ncbi:MAG: glycosyltransferase [Candidatus Bathyarchaeia archaeon]